MSNRITQYLPFQRGYFRGGRTFYRKSLILTLLIACIPGLIIGLSIYWIAGNQVERELQKLHHNQIMQRVENIDDQFAYLELSLTHWAFDPKFDGSLRRLDVVNQYEEVQDLYKTLLVMEGTNPLIQRVELYLSEPNPILFNQDGYTFLTDEKTVSAYNGLLHQEKNFFTTFNYWGNANNDTIAMVYKIPEGMVNPFGNLIVTLDPTKLAKLLGTLTPNSDGSSFLLQENGDFAVTTSPGGKPSSLDTVLRAEIGKQNERDGSFLLNFNKTTYSVSYGQLHQNVSNWTYVSATPVDAITAPVVLISKVTSIVSLSGLLLAALLSWFASRRLYSPVDRLVRLLSGRDSAWTREDSGDEFELIATHWDHLARESRTLQTKLEEQLPHLKEGFLLQLVQGYLYSLSERDILDRMAHYGQPVDNKRFVAFIVQLSGFSNVAGRFYQGDEDLVTFAAANIARELADDMQIDCEIVNFHDLSIGLLLLANPNQTGEALRASLQPFCDSLTRGIHSFLKMEVIIAISTSTLSVKHIPYLFEEARQALSYRNLWEGNQVLDIELLNRMEVGHDFKYPFTLEKEIIHMIRMGMEEDAKQLIGQFLTELSINSSKRVIIQQGLLQLLGSIQHAILQSGLSPYELFDGANLYDQLTQLNEPEQIVTWFHQKIIQPFIQVSAAKQDGQIRQMVEKVILLLQKEYMTPISLETCADHIRTNPYTLSKAFKQVTGLNFIDYLTRLRLERSKELLKTTELRINEIAESVGYQPTYFHRIFKKEEGVTPSQFREMSRAE